MSEVKNEATLCYLPNAVLEMTSPVKALNSGKTSNSVREFLRINKRYALLR
jgi:hypothetical protein